MASTFSLAPNPKWYIADLTGKPLGGGSMWTYRSLDRRIFKFVFQDAAGTRAWPNPVLFDENGSQGPFYWEVDDATPDNLYYIEIFDAAGVLQWTINDFPIAGAGGGGGTTTALNLTNLVTNNALWRNSGTVTPPSVIPTISPLTTTQFIAPGAHTAITYSVDLGVSPVITAAPDIYFFKSNTTATDAISFPIFSLGSGALTSDVTPPHYIKYACTGAGTAEAFKFVQFAICPNVQNLTNQDMILTIWARGNSGTQQLFLRWMQFFGDGTGASAPLITPIQTLNLTPVGSWEPYRISAPVPDVTTKIIGSCGNSALFLQIGYPLSAACDIDFILPSLFLGSVSPLNDFLVTDNTDAIINSPRTGDIKLTSNTWFSNIIEGWVTCNDGSIGNASSGGTERANVDTFPLFQVLWESTSNSDCPIQNSAGAPVGARGASAAADFDANYRMPLPKILGRAIASLGLASSGSAVTWRNAEVFGEQNHVLVLDELADHTHTLDGNPVSSVSSTGTSGGSSDFIGSLGSSTTGATPGHVADGHNTMQPTTFFKVIMKL